MQEIKVTRCNQCPMFVHEDDYGEMNTCKNGAFKNEFYLHHDSIHPNCPLKGETITFKIGETPN